ncbi:MAG: MBL fold metallo-hydrolase, partial [Ruminococcus sp.]
METKGKAKSKKTVFTVIFIIFAVVLVLFVALADWLKIYELSGVYPKAEKLTVAFIDVGQADAIYINTEKGNILIDAGCSKDAYKVREYLDRYRIKEIDTVIGTHDDWDHIGGMKT